MTHRFSEGSRGWTQVAPGRVRFNEFRVHEGDDAAISGEALATKAAESAAEIPDFDLPKE